MKMNFVVRFSGWIIREYHKDAQNPVEKASHFIRQLIAIRPLFLR
jgi:hypothetical protein